MNQSATYSLRFQKRNGEEFQYVYNPHTSELISPETNQRITPHPSGMELGHGSAPVWTSAQILSPLTGLPKSPALRALKIQLGNNHPAEAVDSLADAKRFIENLPLWLEAAEEGLGLQVEFSGGEPFIYWAAMKFLAEALQERYPMATFTVFTQGALLDQEKIGWLDRMGFAVVVKHDGPGQKASRGTDLFDDPGAAENLQQLYLRLRAKGLIRFCCVLSGNNLSISAVRDYLAQRLHCRPHDIPISTGQTSPVCGRKGSQLPPDVDHAGLLHGLFFEVSHGNAVHTHTIKEKLQDFYRSLDHARPSSALGQSCGMDREDTLAVDLKGNALTCQTAAADDGHKIGSVHDYPNIRLNTGWHWSLREECPHCPVLQLCKGGCLRLDGDQWRKACDSQFAYHLALLASGLYFLTGGVLKEVEGDVMRRKGLPTVVQVIAPDLITKAG